MPFWPDLSKRLRVFGPKETGKPLPTWSAADRLPVDPELPSGGERGQPSLLDEVRPSSDNETAAPNTGTVAFGPGDTASVYTDEPYTIALCGGDRKPLPQNPFEPGCLKIPFGTKGRVKASGPDFVWLDISATHPEIGLVKLHRKDLRNETPAHNRRRWAEVQERQAMPMSVGLPPELRVDWRISYTEDTIPRKWHDVSDVGLSSLSEKLAAVAATGAYVAQVRLDLELETDPEEDGYIVCANSQQRTENFFPSTFDFYLYGIAVSPYLRQKYRGVTAYLRKWLLECFSKLGGSLQSDTSISQSAQNFWQRLYADPGVAKVPIARGMVRRNFEDTDEEDFGDRPVLSKEEHPELYHKYRMARLAQVNGTPTAELAPYGVTVTHEYTVGGSLQPTVTRVLDGALTKDELLDVLRELGPFASDARGGLSTELRPGEPWEVKGLEYRYVARILNASTGDPLDTAELEHLVGQAHAPQGEAPTDTTRNDDLETGEPQAKQGQVSAPVAAIRSAAALTPLGRLEALVDQSVGALWSDDFFFAVFRDLWDMAGVEGKSTPRLREAAGQLATVIAAQAEEFSLVNADIKLRNDAAQALLNSIAVVWSDRPQKVRASFSERNGEVTVFLASTIEIAALSLAMEPNIKPEALRTALRAHVQATTQHEVIHAVDWAYATAASPGKFNRENPPPIQSQLSREDYYNLPSEVNARAKTTMVMLRGRYSPEQLRAMSGEQLRLAINTSLEGRALWKRLNTDNRRRLLQLIARGIAEMQPQVQHTAGALETALATSLALSSMGDLPASENPQEHTTQSQRSQQYDALVREVAEAQGVDPKLIHAMVAAESRYLHDASSPRGAQGLMQVTPITARQMGVPMPTTPRENIELGTRYMAYLLRMFKHDVELALAAYNRGPTAVRESIQTRGEPPKVPETVAYVRKVLRQLGLEPRHYSD